MWKHGSLPTQMAVLKQVLPLIQKKDEADIHAGMRAELRALHAEILGDDPGAI
jgi:hypothetical protein